VPCARIEHTRVSNRYTACAMQSHDSLPWHGAVDVMWHMPHAVDVMCHMPHALDVMWHMPHAVDVMCHMPHALDVMCHMPHWTSPALCIPYPKHLHVYPTTKVHMDELINSIYHQAPIRDSSISITRAARAHSTTLAHIQNIPRHALDTQ